MKILPVNTFRNSVSKINEKQIPSFSGTTVNPYKRDSEGVIYVELLGKNMSEVVQDPWNYNTLQDYIAVYNTKVEPYHKFEKAGNPDIRLLYIADPNEKISDKIFNSHSYIVKDTEPPLPSLEQLEEKYKSRKPVEYDYQRDFEHIFDYNLSLNETAKENIKKAHTAYKQYEKASQTYNNYQYCRPVDIIKLYEDASQSKKKIQEENKIIERAINRIDMSKNMVKLLQKSSNDFKQRDYIINTLEYIDKNYPDVDKKLKDLEVEKYFLDENTERMQKELVEVRKREAEEAEKCGPSYNQSYPPSPTYYHRTYLQNQCRNNIEKSAQLQKLYDEYLDLKNNGPQRKMSLEKELDLLLQKMSDDFEKVKDVYEEYKDIVSESQAKSETEFL